ncbi:MAG: hypothetical protein PHQ86_03925 [Dehalococcoidales bacterium]|nr:hypothetical protein [Dehalococcoidales bacterium]
MFSKEWFVYVFGRWILLSGIAGALVQYLFADKLGILTIPAFLLNQFILACIFWYVDKYIFQRHFGRIKTIFKFPRIRGQFDPQYQFIKVSEEFSEYANAFEKSPEDYQAWLNQFLDLLHAIEMTERVLREKGIDIDKEYYSIIKKNEERHLYD